MSFCGIVKPESLKFDLAGYWFRRITEEHKIFYKVIDKNVPIFY